MHLLSPQWNECLEEVLLPEGDLMILPNVLDTDVGADWPEVPHSQLDSSL